MPELPEVETTLRGIESRLENQTIKQVIVHEPRLRLPVPLDLPTVCAGQTIHSLARRGKYLLINITSGCLLIHLGMSGHLKFYGVKAPLNKHDHIELLLSNGLTLRYNDPRRFGLWLYTAHDPLMHPLLAALGPEPLSKAFNLDYLFSRTQSKKQSIKALLMDNHVVVGIGNIYATESLFKAYIHPALPAKCLNKNRLSLLVDCIKQVLQEAIKAGGTTLKDFYAADGKPGYFAQKLHAYGREGMSCYRCGHTLESIFVAGRRSAFCAHCQPL